MENKVITDKQDLTYLLWSHARNSSGTAGTFLKSQSLIDGRKIYYKLSNFDNEKGVIDYIENGSIKNSVNYPNCEVAKLTSRARITLLHKNIPSMITKFTTVLSSYNVNIEEMVNKSRGDYAYSVFDIDMEVTEEMKKALEEIEGVLKVRAI